MFTKLCSVNKNKTQPTIGSQYKYLHENKSAYKNVRVVNLFTIKMKSVRGESQKALNDLWISSKLRIHKLERSNVVEEMKIFSLSQNKRFRDSSIQGRMPAIMRSFHIHTVQVSLTKMNICHPFIVSYVTHKCGPTEMGILPVFGRKNGGYLPMIAFPHIFAFSEIDTESIEWFDSNRNSNTWR